MLDHTKVPYSAVAEFVQIYTVPFDPSRQDIVDLENPPPSKGAQLPCVQAVEFLADIHEREGGEESVAKAIKVRSETWVLHLTI